MRYIGLSLGLTVLATFAAAADTPDIDKAISAYNQAVSSGDAASRVRAAKELGEAAMAHPKRDDAALLAYEAGQTLCVYAACDGASPIAAFAAGQSLEDGPVQPADIALLNAYSDWQDKKTGSSRKALDEALESLVGADLTMLTLAAFHNRYSHDANEGHWRKVEKSAHQAAIHFAPFKNVIGEQWSEAAMAAIVGSFNSDPDTDDALAMARHHVALGKLSASSDENAEWLKQHWYISDAWQMAMSAYFHSGGGRRLSGRIRGPDPDKLDAEIGAIMTELDNLDRTPATEDVVIDPDDLPYCNGRFDMDPPLRYPFRAAKKGMFGAAIARIAVNGHDVTEVEILAAVPSDTFEKSAEKTIRKWRWQPAGTPGETCRAEHPNLVQPLIFALGN
ncbi:MAG: energy transducer TonB [Henriciella sp.]|uniref:energy transducer TonB n=1 Tax=Henriciella sp. TaxID=1968823 RepID=UPI0032EE2BD1